ncbi:MAG TPA: hypothetical protein DCR20_11890 [Planctomycetaceae bacterium]|nr:hypothetical protein [Planctomycetaceae bacterium]
MTATNPQHDCCSSFQAVPGHPVGFLQDVKQMWLNTTAEPPAHEQQLSGHPEPVGSAVRADPATVRQILPVV